jgi:hypothetical protein
VGPIVGAQCNRHIGDNGGGVVALFIMFSSPACGAISAVAAIGCIVAGADDAGTALACGAVNAGLFGLLAVYCSVKA